MRCSLATPALFFSPSGSVTAISPTSDDEVVALLDRAHRDFAEAGAIDASRFRPTAMMRGGDVTVQYRW